jgi:cytochrome oxidase Cu insertion factor (SCO1/SenC/PrrC family)
MNQNIKSSSLSFITLAGALLIPLLIAAQPAQALQSRSAKSKTSVSAVVYSCPMHPEITSSKPGKCPKCGMALRKRAVESKINAIVSEKQSPANSAADIDSKLRIPDVAVYDQNGQRLNFYTDLVKGKTVLINFIFTTCTTICPPLTATFRRVQQELGERVGRDVQLISVSVDPTVDVPERLKSFADKFKAGPGWSFVTGSKQDIDQLLKSLGAYTGDKNDHTPMVLVGNDAAHFWTRTYGLTAPSTLVKVVNEAAGRSEHASSAQKDSNSNVAGAVSGPQDQSKGQAKAGEPDDVAAKYFPNLVLLTQDNKTVHFYEDLLKGKVVLINFMFATCKGVCSPMTANLAKVQSYLGDHLGRDVAMISITVDPEMDTPAALKKYAASHKAKPGWYFLTGEKKNVDWVLYKLGGYVEDKNEHTTVLILGNVTTGEWMKMHAMSNPTEIADAVTKLLASKKSE